MSNHSRRTERICEFCKAKFSVPPSLLSRKFCSNACRFKGRVGLKHSDATKEKMRDARLANNPMKGSKHTEETRAKMRAAKNSGWMKGRHAHNWKGGRIYDRRGYVMIYMPDHPNSIGNYVFEHRLVMENHLGRYLTSDEVVHHDNEIRDDNRIENLVLTTSAEHSRLHRLKEVEQGTWHRGNRGQGAKKT